MTLRQLRYLCEIVRRGLHVSRAAEALNASQPGVSKQIQLLENQLGVVIFNRRRNRTLSLTPAGEEIYRFAERVLLEVNNIRDVGLEFGQESKGRLAIATTHTQARYVLPAVIGKFVEQYPLVQLEFWQGPRQEIFRRVALDQSDIAIGTYNELPPKVLTLLPYSVLKHRIVTRRDHPLLQRDITIASIADYPIITHSFEESGEWKFGRIFADAGLTPHVAFRATDADVCKAYAKLGIGIAILSDSACLDCDEMDLQAIPVDHILEPEPLYIGLRRNRHHRRFLFRFIEMLAPSLERVAVQSALTDSASVSG